MGRTSRRPDAGKRVALPPAPCALVLALSLVALAPHAARAQPRGAAALHQLVGGLTVTPRVLVMGAHPDDDDPLLIAWLARGRHVETGYLSLTRGEGGENFIGGGSGVSLGAIRTGELLAARRVDGGRSFFTRAYDFGYSRTAEEALEHWDHDALLDDVITIIRSFRPHALVAVFAEGFNDGNGQHEVLGRIAREAFDAAGDTIRCPAARCGAPWTPLELYRHGDGLSIDAGEYDPVLGRTYAEIALESRAQHRSGGLLNLFAPPQRSATLVRLRRVASHAGNAATPGRERSIFDGVDTSFARLAAGAPSGIARALASFVAVADSVRTALDLAHPATVVDQLARAAHLADAIRGAAPRCRHPSADAAPPAAGDPPCDPRALDLDASIDLVRRRAHDALLAAAGVSVEATAGRELVAETDRVAVVVTVANHGAAPVTLEELFVSGAPASERTPIVVPPDSTVRLIRSASGLGPARPWWIASRAKDAFPLVPSAQDGIERPAGAAVLTVPGITLPEEIRRTSDVRVTLTLAGVTISTSVGPIIHHSASPTLGVQRRPVGAVPAVTLAFERTLEWIPAGTPIDRRLRLTLRSYSDSLQTFAIRVALAPAGIRVDSLQPWITLAPREQRELFVRLRGELPPGRHQFGVVGRSATGQVFLQGFRTIEHPHLLPVRDYRSSGVYLQAVKVDIPPKLVVAFVRGVGDDGEGALRQLGVPTRGLTPDELAQADLSRFTTIVIGPRAYEAHPELPGQTVQFLSFARNGGTLVVLNGQQTTRSRTLLPHMAALSLPFPEHVTVADAPVTVLEPRSRLLTWPNRVGPEDWRDWVRERALYVPTEVDPRYEQVVEMHDPGQRENRNTILVTPLGKGTYVYSTITFFEQLPGGVPGSLRLFVNLLSAGCRPSGSGPAKC